LKRKGMRAEMKKELKEAIRLDNSIAEIAAKEGMND